MAQGPVLFDKIVMLTYNILNKTASKGGTVLIVGDECYSFVKELSLTVNDSERILTISLDADAFISEFMTPAEAEAKQCVKRGEKSGL